MDRLASKVILVTAVLVVGIPSLFILGEVTFLIGFVADVHWALALLLSLMLCGVALLAFSNWFEWKYCRKDAV